MKLVIVHRTEPHLVRPGQRIWHDGEVLLVDEVRLRLDGAEIATRPEGRAVNIERKGKVVATKRDILRVEDNELVDVMIDPGTAELVAFKIADFLGETYTLVVDGIGHIESRAKQLLIEPEPEYDDSGEPRVDGT